MNLELLLSDHNADCITCEKHGSCRLEKYAYQYGIRKPRMNGDSSGRPFLDEHPFIVRDYTKCILCGRCVYACNEIQYDNAININGRGFTATVGTSFNRMLDATTCTSCGRCISVCPVGCIDRKEQSRAGT